jgi:hypothetical protein
VHDQPVTDARANKRTGNITVVGPGFDLPARLVRDAGDFRFEVDLDNVRVGIRVDRLAEFDFVIPSFGLKRLSGAE